MVSKGAASPLMGIMIGAVVVFLGIMSVSYVVNSIYLPTQNYDVTNESLAYATNATAQALAAATKAACLSDTPVPSSCGATGNYVVMNASLTVNSTCYSVDRLNNQITITAQDGGLCMFHPAVATWSVSYDNYDYVSAGGGTTFQSTQTTWWNGIQLAAVSLITLAASIVIGSFFFGK